jgi:phage-related protein
MAKRPSKAPVQPQDPPEEKPVFWAGGTLDELRSFPRAVRSSFGEALYRAQIGGRAENTKIMKGFKGAGVVEIVEDHDGNTYRAVYTVKFREAVFVLHVFQKKSTKGVATPIHQIKRIKERLRDAEVEYKRLHGDE